MKAGAEAVEASQRMQELPFQREDHRGGKPGSGLVPPGRGFFQHVDFIIAKCLFLPNVKKNDLNNSDVIQTDIKES